MQIKGLEAHKRLAIRWPGATSAMLWKRRAWYADEAGTTGGDAADTTNAGDAAQNIDALPAWAKGMIADLRKEAGDHRVKAKKESEARVAAEAAALTEQGKYKELWEKAAPELEALRKAAERATALETKIQATNDARILRIPQQWHSAIPKGYSPEQLSEWLDTNEQLFAKKPAPNLDGGAGNDGSGSSAQLPKLTDLEKELAKLAGITPEAYAKRKAEKSQPPNL